MSSKRTSLLKTICRDYWRIEIISGAPDGEPDLLTIAGRRRTTEPFWAPLGLPLNETGRLLAAVAKAAALADRMADGRSGQAPLFPAHEVMAACRGPFYVIELAETTCRDDKASVLFTLLPIRGAIRPAVYLIDAELQDFLVDLEKIAAFDSRRSPAHVDGRAVIGESRTNGGGRLA
jgi:hypothetical protein